MTEILAVYYAFRIIFNGFSGFVSRIFVFRVRSAYSIGHGVVLPYLGCWVGGGFALKMLYFYGM